MFLEVSEHKKIMRYAYALLRAVYREYGVPLYTTSIHKLVYFTLAKFNDQLLRKTYGLYYYGPYSDDLMYALNILREAKYVKTETEKYGVLYSISDKKAPPLLEEERQVYQVVKELVSAVHEQGILNNIAKLAELSKTHFLRKFYPELRTSQELARKAKILGWKLLPTRIDLHLSVLREANLLQE